MQESSAFLSASAGKHSKDATLPDVLRLWDSFIADPKRYAFAPQALALVSHFLGERGRIERYGSYIETKEQ